MAASSTFFQKIVGGKFISKGFFDSCSIAFQDFSPPLFSHIVIVFQWTGNGISSFFPYSIKPSLIILIGICICISQFAKGKRKDYHYFLKAILDLTKDEKLYSILFLVLESVLRGVCRSQKTPCKIPDCVTQVFRAHFIGLLSRKPRLFVYFFIYLF